MDPRSRALRFQSRTTFSIVSQTPSLSATVSRATVASEDSAP